jgi:hypothetical protein
VTSHSYRWIRCSHTDGLADTIGRRDREPVIDRTRIFQHVIVATGFIETTAIGDGIVDRTCRIIVLIRGLGGRGLGGKIGQFKVLGRRDIAVQFQAIKRIVCLIFGIDAALDTG